MRPSRLPRLLAGTGRCLRGRVRGRAGMNASVLVNGCAHVGHRYDAGRCLWPPVSTTTNGLDPKSKKHFLSRATAAEIYGSALALDTDVVPARRACDGGSSTPGKPLEKIDARNRLTVCPTTLGARSRSWLLWPQGPARASKAMRVRAAALRAPARTLPRLLRDLPFLCFCSAHTGALPAHRHECPNQARFPFATPHCAVAGASHAGKSCAEYATMGAAAKAAHAQDHNPVVRWQVPDNIIPYPSPFATCMRTQDPGELLVRLHDAACWPSCVHTFAPMLLLLATLHPADVHFCLPHGICGSTLWRSSCSDSAATWPHW